MKILAIGAGDDLAAGLARISADEALSMSFAQEGIELKSAGSLEEALAIAKGSKEGGLPEIAIADGPGSIESANRIREALPEAKIAAVLPQGMQLQSPLNPSITLVKRPLLPGELDSLVRALTELRSGTRNFEGLFNSAPSMMAVISPTCQIAAWNFAAAGTTRINAKKAAGMLIWEALPFLKEHVSSFERAISSLQTERLNRVSVESPGEEARYYNVSISPLPGTRGAVVRLDDVSDEVKKDEHLRQAQKMDSVGSLAAGLAHDFNNVIGGVEATMSSIKFSLDMAASVEELKKSIESDFELVDESVKRGKDIVAQLMALSRRKEMPLSPVDLNSMVGDVVKICRNTLPKCIVIDSMPWQDGPAMVMAFPTQIEQAVLNLCINASHAMTIMRKEGEEQKGTLSVSVTPIEVGENITSVIPEAAKGKYWLLSVSDTGVGMTREIMAKIFEPFFTTKEKGKGTGLGLAMVYNIIRQHKGFMDIFSEPGLGSTFLVFLPVLKED